MENMLSYLNSTFWIKDVLLSVIKKNNCLCGTSAITEEKKENLGEAEEVEVIQAIRQDSLSGKSLQERWQLCLRFLPLNVNG